MLCVCALCTCILCCSLPVVITSSSSHQRLSLYKSHNLSLFCFHCEAKNGGNATVLGWICRGSNPPRGGSRGEVCEGRSVICNGRFRYTHNYTVTHVYIYTPCPLCLSLSLTSRISQISHSSFLKQSEKKKLFRRTQP